MYVIAEITAKAREKLSPSDRSRLEREDRDEQREMKAMVVQAMLADGVIPQEKRPRISGTADWKRRRGEDGSTRAEEQAREVQDHRMEQDGH